MALGTTGISTTLVANTIGEGSNDVGTLCTSDKINRWSKFKPMILSESSMGLSPSGTYPNSLIVVSELINSNMVYYLRPLDISDLGSEHGYYRFGDFRNYEHNQNIQGKPIVRFSYLNLFSGEHTFNYTKYITRAELLKNIIYYNGGNIDYSGDARPLTLETPTGYIWPKDLVVNSKDEIEISGTFNTLSNKAYWIFDDVSFNSETTLITFMDPGNSNRICLDRDDAIAIPTSVIATGTFSRHTTIDPHVGGSTTDVPIKPDIKFGTVTPPDTDIYTPDFFYIQRLWLRAQDSTSQGGGIAYSIFMDFAADYHKYGGKTYDITISTELWNIDYDTKTKVVFDWGDTYATQYVDNGGTPNFGQTQGIRHTFSAESSYDSKWIHLQNIPFDGHFAGGYWPERSTYAIKLIIKFTQV